MVGNWAGLGWGEWVVGSLQAVPQSKQSAMACPHASRLWWKQPSTIVPNGIASRLAGRTVGEGAPVCSGRFAPGGVQ